MAKVYYDDKYLALGAIGALIILYGYMLQSFPQPFYIFGSLILLITAIHYKLVYFIALQLILSAGHIASLLGIGLYIQFALPVLLCLQLLVFYLMMGKQNNLILMIGITGIALFSIGIAYSNNWVFFSGGACIAIYSYYIAYKGHYASYIWAFLNTTFACLALYKIFL